MRFSFASQITESRHVGGMAKEAPLWMGRAFAKHLARRQRRHRQDAATLREAQAAQLERLTDRARGEVVTHTHDNVVHVRWPSLRTPADIAARDFPAREPVLARVVRVEFRRKGGAIERYDLRVAA